MKNFLALFLKSLLLAILNIRFASAIPQPPADGETSASLSCIYGLTPSVAGCPISTTTAVPTAGSGIIAVIE